MKLYKDGKSVEINNPIHIRAYVSSGWREKQEPTPKQEIPQETVAEHSKEPAKRGRKKAGD